MPDTASTDSRIVAAYRERTPASARLAAEARALFPGGITHDGRRLVPHGLYCARAEGSRKWDVDGNEYVDYFGGHGALILGHAHAGVEAAVREALAFGTHFGAGHEYELRWGRLIQALIPCAERVRFTASGTESAMLAFRLARAFTGRERIVHFAAHFHGWQDQTVSAFDADYRGVPEPGIPVGVLESMVAVPPRNLEALEATVSGPLGAAAVILEPTGPSWGLIPYDREFVQAVTDIARRHGALVIFDEVITGFRVSPGGAQAALGIIPDLAVLAKIVAGGLPGGAVAGRKDVLDGLDFDVSETAGRIKVQHHGTFNANPVTAAAGAATLDILRTSDACDRANAAGEALRSRLNIVLEDMDVPWAVYGHASCFYFFLNPGRRPIRPTAFDPARAGVRELKVRPPETARALRLSLLVHGVDLSGSLGGVLSAAHTADDLEDTAAALARAIDMMRAEGLAPAIP